jgi:hypothetical protein
VAPGVQKFDLGFRLRGPAHKILSVFRCRLLTSDPCRRHAKEGKSRVIHGLRTIPHNTRPPQLCPERSALATVPATSYGLGLFELTLAEQLAREVAVKFLATVQTFARYRDFCAVFP